MPDMVIGLKVSEPAKVTAQLKRLDTLLADALKETPLKGASSRIKVGGDEFLVLKLDASLIPWDAVPLGIFEQKPGEFAPLLARLKKLKTTISVGVRAGYLLIGIGESAATHWQSSAATDRSYPCCRSSSLWRNLPTDPSSQSDIRVRRFNRCWSPRGRSRQLRHSFEIRS